MKKFTFLLRSKTYIYIFATFLLFPNLPIQGEPGVPPLPQIFSKVEPGRMEQEPPLLAFKPKTIMESVLLRSQQMFGQEEDHYSGEFLSLAACIERAKRVHGPLNVALKQLQLAKMRLNETKRNLLPSAQVEVEGIEGSSVGEDFRGRGWKFKMQQTVWNHFKQWKLYRQAKLNVEVATQNYGKILSELEADVTQSYYLCAQKRLVYEEWLKLKTDSTSILDSVQKRYEKKVIRQVELFAAQKQAHDIQYQVSAAKNEWHLAQFSLRQLLRLYSASPLQIAVEIPYPSFTLTIDQCLQQAFQQRSDYLLGQLSVDIAKYEKEILSAEAGVKIDVDSSYGRRAEAFESEDLDFEDEFFIGLRGSIPFWNHILESNSIYQDTVPAAGQTTSTDFKSQTVALDLFKNNGKSTKLEAEILLRGKIEDLEKIKRTVFFEVTESFFNYEKAHEQFLGTAENKKLQSKEAEFMKIQVGLDEANLSTLLESLIRKTQADVDHYNSLNSYLNSIVDLYRTIGASFTPEE